MEDRINTAITYGGGIILTISVLIIISLNELSILSILCCFSSAFILVIIPIAIIFAPQAKIRENTTVPKQFTITPLLDNEFMMQYLTINGVAIVLFTIGYWITKDKFDFERIAIGVLISIIGYILAKRAGIKRLNSLKISNKQQLNCSGCGGKIYISKIGERRIICLYCDTQYILYWEKDKLVNMSKE